MDIFIARQAILTKAKEVYGYELLFRSSERNAVDTAVDGYAATQSVMADAMVDFGIKELTGGKKAFINFTERNLMDGSVDLLPPEIVVVEVLETVRPTPEIIRACEKIKARGYQLALDDFVFRPGYEPLIELADIIKVDFRITKDPEERRRMRLLVPDTTRLLAEKVETDEEFRQAVDFGYVFFQGYFFCKPAVLHKKAIASNVMAQMMLLRELNDEDIDFREIKKIVESDPQLIQKLFIYINSPGLGVGTEITNLKQALVLLGIEGIRRWILVITLRIIAADKPMELLTLSLVRAKFCEGLARIAEKAEVDKDTAFLMGMFSLLDAIAEADMESIVQEMHLAHELADALLGKKNPLGELFVIVRAYEDGRFSEVEHWCERMEIEPEAVGEVYRTAVDWASQVSMLP